MNNSPYLDRPIRRLEDVMPDLFPVTIDEQIACIDRELGYRRSVYPRRVDAGKMTQQLADKQIAHMEAVLATLQKVKAP